MNLPDDIINFLHNPLACAIALGYEDGVEIQGVPLLMEEHKGFLQEKVAPDGKAVRIVTKINGPQFNRFWLDQLLKG